MEAPMLTIPALEEIHLVPVEVVTADDVPIRDEETRLLRDEDGLTIYEE